MTRAWQAGAQETAVATGRSGCISDPDMSNPGVLSPNAPVHLVSPWPGREERALL